MTTNPEPGTGHVEPYRLPKHLLANIDPQGPAKVRRPQVAKQPFSRNPKRAAAEDGVDTSVHVTRMARA